MTAHDLTTFQQPQPWCPHVLPRAPVGTCARRAGSSRTFGLLCQLWHRGEQLVWALCKGSTFQHSSPLCPAVLCCGARWCLSWDCGCDESARDVSSSEDSQQVPPSSLTASCRYPVLTCGVWGRAQGLGGLGCTSSYPRYPRQLTRAHPRCLVRPSLSTGEVWKR